MESQAKIATDAVLPVSVVIPLFQKERHIKNTLTKAVSSCLQAGCDFEIVVIDDGSTDKSAHKVVEWMEENPSRADQIHLIMQENGGASRARNVGWKSAKHENILFLDADDEWMPDHVHEIITLMRDFPDATLYADAWYEISRDGKRIDHVFGIGSEHRGYIPCFFEAMCSGPMIVSSNTAATRRSHLVETGGFPEGITHSEDKIAWARLALIGEMAWSPVVGAVWNKTSDNRSDQTISAKPNAFREFMAGVLDIPGLSDKRCENIRTAILLEDAHKSGRIRFFDHETPELIRQENQNLDSIMF